VLTQFCRVEAGAALVLVRDVFPVYEQLIFLLLNDAFIAQPHAVSSNPR